MTDATDTTTAAPVGAADEGRADAPAAGAANGTDAEMPPVAPAAVKAAEGDTDTEDDDLSPLEQEGEIAADYLEGLLDIAGLPGDIDMDVEGGRAAVSIVGPAALAQLVGPEGSVLEALQELTRLAVQAETGERSRLMLDVGGHRARRRAELVQVATKAADEARSSGRVALPAMTAFERKVVHDAVAAAGLRSESEGEEPQRHVVIIAEVSAD